MQKLRQGKMILLMLKADLVRINVGQLTLANVQVIHDKANATPVQAQVQY